MKNIITLLFIFCFSQTIAQVELSTNVMDMLYPGASVYVEKPLVDYNVGIGTGIIYRPINTILVDSSSMKGYENFLSHSLINIVQYKWYFSKAKTEKKGWYINSSARIEYVIQWNKAYLEKYEEKKGIPFEKVNLRALELGTAIGYKFNIHNNIFMYTSVGLYTDIRRYFQQNVQINISNYQGHLGIGYRFSR